jgi:sRNA-binding carbon storage regulator CsrA
MLVLRRRSQEAIVFEGGLVLTVVELVDHHAWLAFEGPDIDGAVTIATLGIGPAGATIGVRSPERVTFDAERATVTRAVSNPATDARAVLLLQTPLGGAIELGGLQLEVTSLANERVGLGIDVKCLPSRITVAVHSVSGVEARIGIDAAPQLRVTRKELWLEMLAQNQAAARSSVDGLEARGREPRPTG